MSPFTEFRAEVRAHNNVMRYRRSGAGQCVLLLGADRGPAPLWPELTHVLASNFRLIVPDLPERDTHQNLVRWLSGFLEGLGTASVAVLAAGDFCMPALELAARDLDQVARLVLVPDEGDGWMEEDPPEAPLTASAQVGSVPLLVVTRRLGASAALPTISRFLAVGSLEGLSV